jgi:hypothetical protein
VKLEKNDFSKCYLLLGHGTVKGLRYCYFSKTLNIKAYLTVQNTVSLIQAKNINYTCWEKREVAKTSLYQDLHDIKKDIVTAGSVTKSSR